MEESKKYNELDDDGRLAVYHELLMRTTRVHTPGATAWESMQLPRGAIPETATMFDVSVSTVKRIWGRRMETNTSQEVVAALKNRKGNCARHRVDPELVNQAMVSVPYSNRKTLRAVAEATGFAKSTLWVDLQRKQIRRVSNSLKPFLSAKHKMAPLRWALSFVDRQSLSLASMYEHVHVDEKWFILREVTSTFYRGKEEPEPVRCAQNKRFLPKVMFICAVARPWLDTNGNCPFDGYVAGSENSACH